MGTGVSGLEFDALSQVTTKYSGTLNVSTDAENSSYMDFDTYLKLLVAQMSNQDFNDPMSDAEVLNQMATYSMLEGIKNMTSQSNISYASSLVGKAVTICEGDVYDTGMIDSVIIDNGTPYIIVNGTQHDISTICDIVDADKYKGLSEMLGQTVSGSTSEGKTISGTVTNVLVIGGAEYLVLDKTILCARSSVKIVDPSEITDDTTTDTSTDNTVDSVTDDTADDETNEENVSNETTEAETIAANEYDVSDEIDETNAASSYADTQNNVMSTSYEQRANEIYAELMNSIDGIGNSAVLTDNDTTYDHVYIDYIDVPDYAAVIVGDEDAFLQALANDTPYVPKTRSAEEQAAYLDATSDMSISTSYCEPKRLFADQFPEEAALADAYGTRMFDIRFINNTAITSRINTDYVIGRTTSGVGVTEIGFSGVGKLGEVVTFEDGTQRVEIIHDEGNSSWITTSGNYTLDEICDPKRPSGSFDPQLTASECAIRDYAIRGQETGMNLSDLLTGYGASVTDYSGY